MKDGRRKAAALSYDRSKDNAPRVVARGRGILAAKILEIAKEHGIPIKEDALLAETLSALDLNREIPSELYKAVAEILAFIYRITREEQS